MYRSGAPPCAGCSGFLEPRPLGDVEIDVCAACGGIWFDWFDGELTSLARRSRDVAAPPAPVDPPRERACPRCLEALEVDTVQGAEVLRCGSCAGAFVDRAAAEALAHARSVTKEHGAPEMDPLARLAAWLRDLFFGNARPRGVDG